MQNPRNLHEGFFFGIATFAAEILISPVWITNYDERFARRESALYRPQEYQGSSTVQIATDPPRDSGSVQWAVRLGKFRCRQCISQVLAGNLAAAPHTPERRKGGHETPANKTAKRPVREVHISRPHPQRLCCCVASTSSPVPVGKGWVVCVSFFCCFSGRRRGTKERNTDPPLL